MAVVGTPQASGTGGTGKNVHPHSTTVTDNNPTSLLYIWFISPPSIQEDNRAVKIQLVCPLACRGLSVCAMNVDDLQ